MNMESTNVTQDNLEIRTITDNDLDEVNGGLIFLLLGLVAAFEVGFIAGEVAANYSMTGNFMGNISHRH